MSSTRHRSAVSSTQSTVGYLIAVLGTAALAALLLPLHDRISEANLVLAFLLPVVAAAAAGGLWPGVAAAFLGVIAVDVGFLPPRGYLHLSESQDYVALAVYLVVAVTISYLVSARERRRLQAARRERESRTLYELSTSLVTRGSLDDALRSMVRTVRALFNLRGCAIVLPRDGGMRLAASDGDIPADLRATWEASGGDPVLVRGSGSRTLAAGEALVVPLRGADEPVGALIVVAGGPGELAFGQAERRVLETFANQAALAVEQGQLEEQQRRARTLEETDRLRTALLNSVSHDLRTPLAAIKASVSSLLAADVDWDEPQRREFLTTIDAQVDRLTRLVHNLLDMSRIESGGLEPRLTATSVADVLGPVVRHIRTVSAQRVDVDVPDTLPPVLADPVRLEQVLSNLLDNAGRYAPDSPVTVTAKAVGEQVEIRVVDHGPGVPPQERERVFGQFYRLKGGGRQPEGTGMGLAICRGILGALGGTIHLETTPGGGTTAVVTLPVASERAPARLRP